ncbi:MAG: hypothetical protein U0T84_05150 [Chitinophagales bacterium]
MPLLNEQNNTDDFSLRWYKVRQRVKEDFGQRPDVNAMLFLIGMNEVGIVKEHWEKEEKLDLMHVATCRLLAEDGYYILRETDAEGWPHYEASQQLPMLSVREQEDLLKRKIVAYFENELA